MEALTGRDTDRAVISVQRPCNRFTIHSSRQLKRWIWSREGLYQMTLECFFNYDFGRSRYSSQCHLTRNKRSGQARSAVSEPTPVKCKSTTTNLSNQHCPIDESFGENSAFDPKCDCTMSAASWSKQLKKPRTGRNRYHHLWDEALRKCGHEIVLQFNTSCGTDVEIWQLGNVF